MNDEVLRLSTIGQILRRSSRLLLVLAVLGAVIGATAVVVWPPVYESHTEVLLQGPREKTEVLTEAQIAMSLAVLERTAARLGWGVPGTSLRGSVTAEVTDGNVIGITAQAPDPNRARELAERVTQEYITFSTELVTKAANATSDVLRRRQETVKQQVEDMNQRISQLQGSFQLLDPQNPRGADARAELERLRNKRTDAFQELDDIDKRIGDADVQASVGRESLRIIEPAVTPSATRPPTAIQQVLGAAVLAVVLGALVQVGTRLADRRLRCRSDIAAAAGAPIFGTVAAPVETMAVSTPIDSSGELEDLRYQRVLVQLREALSGSARLLVVVIAGDVHASRAVARLATTAAADDRPVCVMTDGPQLSATISAFVADSPLPQGAITMTTDPCSGPVPGYGTATVLAVVSVSAARPTIPPCPDASGALLALTSGTTTGGELVAVAEACHDAGCPVAGVLLVVQDADAEDLAPQPQPAARTGRHAVGNGLPHGSEVALAGAKRRAERLR